MKDLKKFFLARAFKPGQPSRTFLCAGLLTACCWMPSPGIASNPADITADCPSATPPKHGRTPQVATPNSTDAPTASPDCGTTLLVLHWWTSASERKAADTLIAQLAEENIQWRDVAIPGGAGVGASKVLKSRVLAGTSPEVTQLIGVNIGEWADLGLLLELNSVATANNWNKVLFPTVRTLVQHGAHVVAAPLGIHRINTMFYNRKVFDKLGIVPPKTWDEFERAAAKLKQAGIVPLAQSSEAWQVATLFETLVLAEGGPAYYRELFVQKKPQAFADARLGRALKRLRALKEWMPLPVSERPWTDMVRQLADGGAAMFIMGDWAKGELNAWGLTTNDAFGCAVAPGTENYHLYSIDTLAMLALNYAHQTAQEKMAQVLVSPTGQAKYNQFKGSIPVRRDADLTLMDSCARASSQAFGRGASLQAPSLVHRMATDEASKDAIIAEVHRYFVDDGISVIEVQRRLATVTQVLSKKKDRE